MVKVPRRLLRVIVFSALVTLVACADTTAGDPTPTQTVTLTPSPTHSSRANVEAETRKRLAQKLLDTVCPSDYALAVLENAAVIAGGWAAAAPSSLRPSAKRAIRAVQTTAGGLQQDADWPAEYRTDVAATVDEYFAMVTPLQQIVDADSGVAMGKAWKRLANAPRVAEQRLRTSLGLGLALTNRNGCPKLPRPSVPPSPNPVPSSPDSSPAPGPMPQVNGPMIESTGDALCTTPVYRMPDLVTPSSDPSWTRVIQVMAVQYGFNPGEIDGQYGPKTISAVKGLQSYLGVAPDGQVGPITWTALQNDYCGGPPPY